MKKVMYRIVVTFILSITSLAQAGIIIHGNWCGPGQPREGYREAIKYNLPVRSELDRACKKHDRSYAPGGCGENEVCLCRADAKLLLAAIKQVTYYKSYAEMIAAQKIVGWFSMQTPTICVWGIVENTLKQTEKTVGNISENLGGPKKKRYKNLFNPFKWKL